MLVQNVKQHLICQVKCALRTQVTVKAVSSFSVPSLRHMPRYWKGRKGGFSSPRERTSLSLSLSLFLVLARCGVREWESVVSQYNVPAGNGSCLSH
jgi:hypothetical protein